MARAMILRLSCSRPTMTCLTTSSRCAASASEDREGREIAHPAAAQASKAPTRASSIGHRNESDRIIRLRVPAAYPGYTDHGGGRGPSLAVGCWHLGQVWGMKPCPMGLRNFPQCGQGMQRTVVALPQCGQGGFASLLPWRSRAISPTLLVNSLPQVSLVHSQHVTFSPAWAREPI